MDTYLLTLQGRLYIGPPTNFPFIKLEQTIDANVIIEFVMLEKFTLQPFEHSNMDFHNNLLELAFTDYTLLSGYIDVRF